MNSEIAENLQVLVFLTQQFDFRIAFEKTPTKFSFKPKNINHKKSNTARNKFKHSCEASLYSSLKT